jgi:hypothetical protein
MIGDVIRSSIKDLPHMCDTANLSHSLGLFLLKMCQELNSIHMLTGVQVLVIVITGKVFLFLPVIQKRKNIKTLGNLFYTWGKPGPCTNQIASCFDALSDLLITLICLNDRDLSIFVTIFKVARYFPTEI